ncbi:Dabb family protein [Nonomuraea sp. B12E4]|uniref:Dabb family protein n=1 Tax=Nonomuraea sp. B12E4 TaxID=3153564 RepID=UPI00325D666B
MIRHIVMFTWKEEATAEQKEAVASELGKLQGVIPQIRALTLGGDAGINQGNHDFALVADFDDVEGYLAYRDHPRHQAVIAERIRPILAARAAAQLKV